jgi:hypothetical protein
MLKSRYPLNESFEVTGKWWLPDNPDRRIAGTLNYSTTDITLTLHGALRERDFQEAFRVRSDFERFTQVYGTTSDGIACTILNAIVEDYRFNSSTPEASSTIVSSIYLIVGTHTPNLVDLRLCSLSLRCLELDSFVNKHPLETIPPDNDGEWTITFNHQAPDIYRIEEIKAEIKVGHRAEVFGNQTRRELLALAVVDLKPDTPQTVDWFITTIWRFCDLLTLLSSEPVRPIEIGIRLGQDPLYDGWLLYKSATPYEETDRGAPQLLFALPNVQERFLGILEKWFSAPQPLVKSIHLFREAHREDGASADRFLRATKSLEAYSRATGRAEYMPLEDYQAVERALVVSCFTRNWNVGPVGLA